MLLFLSLTASFGQNYPRTYVDERGDTLTILKYSQMLYFAEQVKFGQQYRDELVRKNLAIVQCDSALAKADQAIAQSKQAEKELELSLAGANVALDKKSKAFSLLEDENSRLTKQNRLLKILGGALAGWVVYNAAKK